MKPVHVFLLSAAAGVVQGAVDLDGSRVVEPLADGDPSPIADTLTYMPEQHDCPLPCDVDYANVHKWTPYYSVSRLHRCERPMLLHFSVLLPLDDPRTDVLIRSCTLGRDPASAGDRSISNATSMPIDNPKLGTGLFQASETSGALVFTASGGRASGQEALALLDGMKDFFDTTDNCDETFLFAYHKQTVAGMHIGAGLGKRTVASVLQFAAGRLRAGDSVANQTVAQICSGGRGAETVFGLSVDTTGDIAGVQRTVLAWSRGDCADGNDRGPPQTHETLAIKVFDIASAPLTDDDGTVIIRPRNWSANHAWQRAATLGKRATCAYIRVEAGDRCASLTAKWGIRGADFAKYNPKPNLCTTLQPGDYVCCSAGDPYSEPKPEAPKPTPDGSCAVHFILNTDTCEQLGKRFGLTEAQIESFNKGKTWGWTECRTMLAGYNMCLSIGSAPLPRRNGWTNTSIPMTDLNPCPLKACCSNWGHCGPFPAHCDIHAPPGGGPGVKLPGFDSTCVSSCGNGIKQNSGPPANFSRIGYYESWNMNRDCLWLKAENANADWSYTHIHWGFAEIDPETWTVVLKDPHNQWQSFKNLHLVKRIVSFGGWAYSTEPATYNIIRQAIIANRETLATNVAKFVMDEGIDGVDIDWEYPGAPDIYVDGVPIGQQGDGVAYLRFLTARKSKLTNNSVSIAAPASYWYLKAFPIDRIAAVIDYIVYMTYDLHGQWDYGNPNAYDSCPSGKCIRSHVNLTETRNTLSLITKAGVPNNKIFVGEASYGRSFHMAVDGCWGPTCDFTGTGLQSDAKPGRCTNSPGYMAYAEINEPIRSGAGQVVHDHDSNTDVLLYEGDYISYMTPKTMKTRQADWKKLNFAGTIDWAIDLQAFGKEDFDVPATVPSAGEEGCIVGESPDLNADSLCQFACAYGFCPEPTCICTLTGPAMALPAVVSNQDFMAWDELNVDLQRLGKFACKYGYCPPDSCTTPVVDEYEDGSVDSSVDLGGMMDRGKYNDLQTQCMLFKYPEYRDPENCLAECIDEVEAAKAEGRTTNYGCVGNFPLDKDLPWTRYPGSQDPDNVYVPGKCVCDNMLVNFIADTIIDTLPIIAQIGCYVVMSTFKLVLDVGLQAIPGAGKILDAGLDTVATAAQLLSYAYPPDQDPVGAFSWWLSPCGGDDLVPDEIKQVFDTLSSIADGVSSFEVPKNIPKGSGKKGDAANPTDRSKPKAGTGTGPNGTGNGAVKKKTKCRVPPKQSTIILGEAKNTLRLQSCVTDSNGDASTTKDDHIVTSLTFGPTPTTVEKVCSKAWTQAFYHYSSAIAQNSAWDTLKCVHGSVVAPEATYRPGPAKWYRQHDETWRNGLAAVALRDHDSCQVDEWPPRYFLQKGVRGQLMRYLPAKENGLAGQTFKSVCFKPHIESRTPAEFKKKWDAVPLVKKVPVDDKKVNSLATSLEVDLTPSFRFSKFEHAANPLRDAGMWDNPCWPKRGASKDPGFTLWHWDEWYKTHTPNPRYDFSKPYQKGGPNGD
ncbi:hypothetical protein C8A03DRAFT_47714 [Achaetomium macrosporum]|uniref:chitinase n=1 Tax=Achaetomium macrosporum TaxID=79813 RepID=A0AAN7HAH1_9PEZI|nr:hypothetical protein C8A03DRAFT_47714 [Achaetomium macrosporum]